MSSHNLLPAKERKYFFAYHSICGDPFPFVWAEDDGSCVGGRPKYLPDTKVEIMKEDFDNLSLDTLARIYPVKVPSFLKA